MKRVNPTSMLPVLCLAVSAAALAWVVAAGTGFSPVFRLGVSLSLMLTFGLIWVFGIRYPDVGWMVVIASLLSLDTLATPAAAVSSLDLVLSGTTRFALMLALGCFLRAFFRVQLKAAVLEVAFTLAVAVFFVTGLVLAPATFLSLKLNGTMQCYLGAVLLGYAALHGFMSLAPLPPKRQRYVAMVVAACVAAAGLYLLGARGAPVDRPLQTPLTDYGFVTCLAAFLLADLVIFHRNYFKEKASRIAQPHAMAQQEARLELGRSLQALLLPKAGVQRYGEFEVELYFRPAPVMGGDWHFRWELAGESRLILGEVSGKGVQAALGIAAVIGFLHDAVERQLPMEEALRYLNARLLDAFERQLTTTVLAVSLALDGSVELFNCGGAGFFTVTREGGLHMPLNSTPLGVSLDLEIGHAPVPLDHLDILFAGTDGLVDGAGGTRRLLEFFDEEEDLTPRREGVRDQVLALTARAPDADDRTLVVIQRRFAEEELKTPAAG